MSMLVAVANEKGGCGKTTIAMNLAGGLQKAGYRTLVVDVDPQASATAWSIAKGQGCLPFDVQTARQFRNQFAAATERTDYDVILFDCPPGVADPRSDNRLSTIGALSHADLVLVPLRPSTLDFSAAARFVRLLEEQRSVAPHRQVRVVINGRQHNAIGKQAAPQAAVLFAPVGGIVFKTSVGLRTPIAEVSGSGQTIFDYAPKHDAAREFTNLTVEIIECLKQGSQPSTSPNSPQLTPPSPAAAA